MDATSEQAMNSRSRREPTPVDVLEGATGLHGQGFLALARSLRTGVVLLDQEGRPTFANESVRDLLGLEPADQARTLERLRELLPADLHEREGGAVELERRLPGERAVALQTIPIEAGACGALVLVEDVGRTRALEACLVLASRMEGWSLFRSVIHDLKTPLNSLALNLELMRHTVDDLAGDGDVEGVRREQRATIDVMQREIARMGRELDGSLLRSTWGRDAHRAYDARQLLRRVARLLRPSARSAGLRLHVQVCEEPAPLVGDVDRLRQALLSVALNAIEATPRGGELRLRVAHEPDGIVFLVEDDGAGIPSELQETVFEPYFTTKEGGTGIGLTVARSLVQAQGGSLALRSRSGEGTAIEIRLPKPQE